MKVQLEQLDLLRPWPAITLGDGCRQVRLLVRMGEIPVGAVMLRPMGQQVAPDRLRKRLAHDLCDALLKILLHEGLRAGPEALRNVSQAKTAELAQLKREGRRQFVCEEILDPAGLPARYRQWVEQAAALESSYAPPVTVVVCTRDRSESLAGCLERLSQLDCPHHEVLVVDNSREPGPAFELARRLGMRAVHAPEPGLSRARNVALREARCELVAFTDDDCLPEPNWLRRLVRPMRDARCASVAGLVLAARLKDDAELAFEDYGGLTRGFLPVIYSQTWFEASRRQPPQTWRIGAGANMLLRRSVAIELGGFDEDLGAGTKAGCSEDTELWYHMLRCGYTVHYEPRAVVHHCHRATPEALARQVRAYAAGHAAYHWRCLWRYRDLRSLSYLLYYLPKSFFWRWRQSRAQRSNYPLPLLKLEARGTVAGLWAYTAAKLRRLARWCLGRRGQVSSMAAPVPNDGKSNADDLADSKPVRAA